MTKENRTNFDLSSNVFMIVVPSRVVVAMMSELVLLGNYLLLPKLCPSKTYSIETTMPIQPTSPLALYHLELLLLSVPDGVVLSEYFVITLKN